MDINGKLILLTGASGGIGQEVAIALERKGAQLMLVARDLQKLEALKGRLRDPEKHHILAVDLATDSGIDKVKQECSWLAQNGQKIDALINNAGRNQFGFLAQRSVSSIEAEVRLNLIVPMLLSQSALSWLDRPSVILNIGSTFGSIGFPGYSTYCAAKSGLQRFSEAMDRELSGTGIRVLYLAPRATNTDLNGQVVNQMNQKLGNKSDRPSVVAQHVISILEKEQAARWIGWPEKLFARINQIFPSLVSSSIRKQQDTIHYFMNQIQGK